jgi:hypothetical protein
VIVFNDTLVLLVLCLSTVMCLTCASAGYLWYRMRRYENTLQDTYRMHFEHRTMVALKLHPGLAHALARSKIVLDQVRNDLPEVARMRAALEEVSGLLGGAAVEGDRALRSLDTATSDPVPPPVS